MMIKPYDNMIIIICKYWTAIGDADFFAYNGDSK